MVVECVLQEKQKSLGGNGLAILNEDCKLNESVTAVKPESVRDALNDGATGEQTSGKNTLRVCVCVCVSVESGGGVASSQCVDQSTYH